MSERTEREVTTQDVLDLTGLTYRKLDFWVRQGYLCPQRENDREGAGNFRLWTPEELAAVRFMAVLVDGGITPAAAAVYGRQMAELVAMGKPPRLKIGDRLTIEVEGL